LLVVRCSRRARAGPVPGPRCRALGGPAWTLREGRRFRVRRRHGTSGGWPVAVRAVCPRSRAATPRTNSATPRTNSAPRAPPHPAPVTDLEPDGARGVAAV